MGKTGQECINSRYFMQPLALERRGGRRKSPPPPVITFCVALALACAAVRIVHAAGVVTNATEANLRAAMAGGGTVTFVCDGTITLAGTITNSANTVLDAAGHQIIISGGNVVRVFYVNTNSTLTLLNVTVANGAATSGGGIYNDGGSVVLSGTTFQANRVTNIAYLGCGGAIFNSSGTLAATNSLFIGNSAQDQPGSGGAFCSLGGAVLFEGCRFSNNTASGIYASFPTGGDGGPAYGGAVSILQGCTAVIHNCVFTQNLACGGDGVDYSQTPNFQFWFGNPGGSGGRAAGGAIYNLGKTQIQSSLLVNNWALGGIAGGGQIGSGFTDMAYNGGAGGAGGDGLGGAVFDGGTLSLVNSTLVGNSGIGRSGANGGAGGCIYWHGVHFCASGGNTGAAGNGVGAVWAVNLSCFGTNCTIADNYSECGTNGIYSTVYGITNGIASALWFGGGTVVNCILAFNSPSNFCGSLTDAGHNFSSDASIALTGSGSRTNTDPMLGPLANHGGPTLTMALLPGSPAIDAGSAAAAPATDQRGIARPQGPGVDVGAFEFQYIPFFYGAAINNRTNFQLQMAGLLPNQNFTIEASSNLVNWCRVTNFIFGTNPLFHFADPATNCRARFYRLVTP
jgi:hypothetical protein